MGTKTYEVPDISCGHREAALAAEVGTLPGLERVGVDLEHKLVAVTGRDLDDTAIEAAICGISYQAVSS
jgi:copper chaperone CopZ